MTSITRNDLYSAFASLTVQLTEEGFWLALSEFLEHECVVDEFAVFLYRRSEAPHRVFDRNPSAERDRLHGELLQAAYWISPYYNSLIKEHSEPGFYTIDEVAPDAFRESEYYRIYYREKQAADEGMFFVPLEYGVSIGVIAERKLPSPGLSDAEIETLRDMAMLVSALVRQRWRLVGASGAQQSDLDPHMVTALERFGRDVLSSREREIAELILRGHSSKSGARELGISPETERVHRKRMYSKLKISSQAELFWLFIRSVHYFNPETQTDPLQVLLAQRD